MKHQRLADLRVEAPRRQLLAVEAEFGRHGTVGSDDDANCVGGG